MLSSMKLFAVVIALLLLVQGVLAVQRSEYTIENDKVLIIHTVSNASSLALSIPKDAEGISVSGNGIAVPYEIIQQGLRKQLGIAGNYSELKVSYISKELIEQPKNTFFVEEVQVLDSELWISVTLPEKAVLVEPLFDGFGSVYPKPSSVDTDGRTIRFHWQTKTAENTFPLLVEYSTGKQDNTFVILTALGIVAISGVSAFFFLRKKKTSSVPYPPIKEKVIENEKKEKNVKNIELHLKEDEKAVINVLKLKNGSTSQGTLRIATGFSKATLSRLIMELEARNIVLKEKKGKKNLIILKSSIWNDLEQ